MDSFHLLLHLITIISTASVSTGENENRAFNTCSKEGGCPDESIKYDTTIPTDITGELQSALRSITTVEMFKAQRQVAKSLEFGYLSLADHPDQAREVRLTSVKCKNQHMLASGLMGKFRTTAAHIVETLIPMILDAVLTLKDEKVVKDALDQIIDVAEDMKKEAETTRHDYMQIEHSLSDNMGSILSRNKNVSDEKERIRIEMDGAKDQMKATKIALGELDEERLEREKELEMAKLDRDLWREQAGMAGQNMAAGGSDSFLHAMNAGSAFGGGFGAYIGGTIGAIVDGMRHDKQLKKFKIIMEAYRESQRSVERVYDQKRDVLSRQHEQRKVALDKLTELKKLGIESANFGDVKSLFDAFDELGVVQVQLTRIIQFWTHVTNVLAALKINAKPSKLFLKQEDPKHMDRFITGINRTKTGWSMFREACASYVQESDQEIYVLYEFLSAPIDRMTFEARAKRQRDILQEIENDIEATYIKLE